MGLDDCFDSYGYPGVVFGPVNSHVIEEIPDGTTASALAVVARTGGVSCNPVSRVAGAFVKEDP